MPAPPPDPMSKLSATCYVKAPGEVCDHTVLSMCTCVCVCVSGWRREREREGERGWGGGERGSAGVLATLNGGDKQTCMLGTL